MVIVPESARQYFTDHPIDPIERYSAAVQGAILELIIENEHRAESAHPGETLLCDRSVLDAVVYAMFGGDTSETETLFARAQTFLPTYDALFLVDPTGIPYNQDAVRIESADDRTAIHGLFLEVLGARKIRYQLLSGSLGERIRQLRAWMS